MGIHPAGCDCGSYACHLRNKGIQISPAATPNSSNKATTSPAEPRYNSWEKGKAGENRPGGTRMPYLDSKGSPIGVKHMADGKFAKAQERLKHDRSRNAQKA
jgi:hypothetical protein